MRFSYKLKIIYGVCLSTILPFGTTLLSQQLTIAKKYRTYWQKVQGDSMQNMTELKHVIPGLVYDLRYSTKDNFTRERLYKSGKSTFLRYPAALGLKEVQEELRVKG